MAWGKGGTWLSAMLSGAFLFGGTAAVVDPEGPTWLRLVCLGATVPCLVALGYGLGRMVERHPAVWIQGRRVHLGKNVGRVKTLAVLETCAPALSERALEAADAAHAVRQAVLARRVDRWWFRWWLRLQRRPWERAGEAQARATRAVEAEFRELSREASAILELVNPGDPAPRYVRGPAWGLIAPMLAR